MNTYSDKLNDLKNNEVDESRLTFHIKKRMSQRNISTEQLDLILQIGNWNSRGDQIIANKHDFFELQTLVKTMRDEYSEIKEDISKTKKELKQLNRNNVVIWIDDVSVNINSDSNKLNSIKDKLSCLKQLLKKLKKLIKGGEKILKNQGIVLVTENGSFITTYYKF